MASTEEEKRKQAYIHLGGYALLILGFIFFTVGFATGGWLSSNYGGGNPSHEYGLWVYCYGDYCNWTSAMPSWMKATKAMQTMAIMCYLLGILLAFFFHCMEQTMSNPPFKAEPVVLDGFVIAGNILCFIGIIVYGSKGNKEGDLKYSYALSTFSLFLTTPGILMVALTRSKVTSKSTVAPAIATTTTSAHFPQPGTQSNSGGGGGGGGGGYAGQHHNGQGQHNPSSYGQGQHASSSGGGATRNASYPYGRGIAGGEGGDLPYPMHPEGPNNPAPAHSSVAMPEPGPIGGGGRGSRLPPISGAHPSAPLPPSDEEAPPSYFEATGGYSQR
ncbi:uncharacterized protein [Littorina saxatilis]|uniref:Uncharacterized protein n=1 Tax=Littorina saxatilis TaxID=31220 RepID=A0AAN9BVQ3_9CAEN